jgi:hypothetical protein
LLGARRPLRMERGWSVYQIEVGRSRAWVHAPSKQWPRPGPSLAEYLRHDGIGTILEVEHTKRFASARVLLQNPRSDDVSATLVWINIWRDVNVTGASREEFSSAPWLRPDFSRSGIPAKPEFADGRARASDVRPARVAAAIEA